MKQQRLQQWRERNDGQDGRPYHEHIGEYARWRGTILHWYLQSFIDPSIEPTHEERTSVDGIDENHENYDYIRSITLNHEKGPYASTMDEFIDKDEWTTQHKDDECADPVYLGNILWDDVTWATKASTECLSVVGLVDESFSIAAEDTFDAYFDAHTNRDQIIAIEEYVHSECGYAGQFDLLFEDDDGDVILCDIKTSKGVYYDYPRQLAAYANAIEASSEYDVGCVDEVCILRVQPDRREVALHREDAMDGSRWQWFNEFIELNDIVQERTASVDRSIIDAEWFGSDDDTNASEHVTEAEATDVMADG